MLDRSLAVGVPARREPARRRRACLALWWLAFGAVGCARAVSPALDGSADAFPVDAARPDAVTDDAATYDAVVPDDLPMCPPPPVVMSFVDDAHRPQCRADGQRVCAAWARSLDGDDSHAASVCVVDDGTLVGHCTRAGMCWFDSRGMPLGCGCGIDAAGHRAPPCDEGQVCVWITGPMQAVCRPVMCRP